MKTYEFCEDCGKKTHHIDHVCRNCGYDSASLINWGEISRLLTGSRMNIRKNRIPQKYEADVQKLVSYIETWQAEIQTAAIADEAGRQKNKNNLQDVD